MGGWAERMTGAAVEEEQESEGRVPHSSPTITASLIYSLTLLSIFPTHSLTLFF